MRALTLLSIILLLAGCSPSTAPGSDPTAVTTEGGTAAVTNISPPDDPWQRLSLDTTARYRLLQDSLEMEESYSVVTIEEAGGGHETNGMASFGRGYALGGGRRRHGSLLEGDVRFDLWVARV